MKVYLIGHKGWIGNMYIELFKKNNIEYCFSDYRAGSKELNSDILLNTPTHVLCCIGRTHGTRNGKTYNTIDYLQHNDALQENINDNLYAPVVLALFCQNFNIHFTYIGTGCIYTYDEEHVNGWGCPGFTENDKPNFFGSNYSIVKGFTNEIMKHIDCLTLRIRMPIVGYHHPRNFITKITKYEYICSINNSMTNLEELLPVSIEMMKQMETGIYNFTNPGTISHNEILEMYKKYVDNTFTWKNFTEEQQDKVLESKRSNNYLTTDKLTKKYKVKNIKESLEELISKFRQ